ncbi:hypothetical protein [Pseudobacteriovorax antillogorgiicola]|uniref:Chemotaxis protein CheC n=1 Tax=Pseudobacteriovorax antillogorgiicola TaxID=1513793 RepID=A0A1Y6CFA4_9BACT|nr:hypothetical protein [Pseudobacteriovorax antillogorgiicola]TCS47595.1 hypothetical protein EDD56_12036 [Pseudobacteriovorax antillogorgiicola]SMF60182.1 hypothetical protein SAMN06296036_120104 [Pseudobacteriovorax antillogorgiicola]
MDSLEKFSWDDVRKHLGVGIQKASHTLDAMITEPMAIEIQESDFTHYQDIGTAFYGVPVGVVISSFEGPVSGQALAIFNDQAAQYLLSSLVPTIEAPYPERDALKESILIEVGNIIFKSLMSTIVKRGGRKFSYRIPEVQTEGHFEPDTLNKFGSFTDLNSILVETKLVSGPYSFGNIAILIQFENVDGWLSHWKESLDVRLA